MHAMHEIGAMGPASRLVPVHGHGAQLHAAAGAVAAGTPRERGRKQVSGAGRGPLGSPVSGGHSADGHARRPAAGAAQALRVAVTCQHRPYSLSTACGMHPAMAISRGTPLCACRAWAGRGGPWYCQLQYSGLPQRPGSGPLLAQANLLPFFFSGWHAAATPTASTTSD